MRRMEKVTGRSDDMIILRGVNLFPTQIEELILRTPELSPHFQCVLRRDGRLDSMTVRVERRPLATAADAARAGEALVGLVKATIGVSVAVEVVEPEGIERSVGKMRRIVDERRAEVAVRTAEGERFPRVDWYGEDLGASVFVGCEFVDADLTEVTTRGARFEDCEFRGGQLNASTHEGSSFTGCRFARTSFFAASLIGCKLVGSSFSGAKLRPMTVAGGNWSYVSLRGANLSGLDLSGVRLVEADLAEADLRQAVLRDADLTRAVLRSVRLEDTDLVGADLTEVDLAGLEWNGSKVDSTQALLIAEAQGAVIDG